MKEMLLKGEAAEEILRNYFINIGYYVVRGCKFRFDQFDVTDIDLWLYCKKSAVTRERINVDIKNKKTPQALERIFWAKGLQSVLNFDDCVVATTDSRAAVTRFGMQHGVIVLDGAFLSRLMKSERGRQHRIVEETLMGEIDRDSLGKLGGDWRGRYETGKSRLLDSLTFDGCNAWLSDIGYFLENAAQDPSCTSSCWRLVYLFAANFLIGVDFTLAPHLSAGQQERRQILEDGFRFGSAGKAYTDKIARLASSLVASVVTNPGLRDSVQHALHEQAMSVNADLLADHLTKGSTTSTLFDLALEFEASGFSCTIPRPTSLNVPAQSFLGVLADFHGIDRKRILI